MRRKDRVEQNRVSEEQTHSASTSAIIIVIVVLIARIVNVKIQGPHRGVQRRVFVDERRLLLRLTAVLLLLAHQQHARTAKRKRIYSTGNKKRDEKHRDDKQRESEHCEEKTLNIRANAHCVEVDRGEEVWDQCFALFQEEGTRRV
jgi:hypothetical protein